MKEVLKDYKKSDFKLDNCKYKKNYPYSIISELKKDKIEKDTERDYFLSAKESKNYGLIDKIIENKK